MHGLLVGLHDHFIPHKRNGHHPRLLRHGSLFGMAALLVTIKFMAIGATLTLPAAGGVASEITAHNIAILTNDERTKAGLDALTLNADLADAAQNKAEDMAFNQYFGHVSPSGKTANELILISGYPAEKTAENLAVRFSQAEEVQQGWLSSESHRKNILNPDYQDLGIGISNGTYKGLPAIFVVQLFGRPTTTKRVTSPATSTSTASVTSSPVTTEAASLFAGILQQTSHSADSLVIFLIATTLLISFSVRLHEKHLSTLAHAMTVIGLALMLRLT